MIAEKVQGLAAVLESEVRHILDRASDYEFQFQKVIEDSTLLRRKEAARVLACSLAKLDRLTANGELEATHLDSHPRYRLSELRRLIEARSGGRRPRDRRGRLGN